MKTCKSKLCIFSWLNTIWKYCNNIYGNNHQIVMTSGEGEKWEIICWKNTNSSKIIKLVVGFYSLYLSVYLNYFIIKKTFNVCFCQLFLHCTSDMPYSPFIQPIVTIFFRKKFVYNRLPNAITVNLVTFPLGISVLSMTVFLCWEFYSLLTTQFFPHHSFFPQLYWGMTETIIYI